MSIKAKKQILFSCLFLFSGLILILQFRTFLWVNLVEPAALLLWAGWQVILSVDQQVYWHLLIWGSFFFFFRLIPSSKGNSSAYTDKESVKAIKGTAYWHTLISTADKDLEKRAQLRRDLEKILILGLAMQQRTGKTEVRDRLISRQISCPDFVYNYFFSTQQLTNEQQHTLKDIHSWIPVWLRRLYSHERKQYHQTLNDVLQWMEQTLEVTFDSSTHS
jgi:hypothetical protein